MLNMYLRYHSACLGRDAEVRVLLPNRESYPAGHRFPTLYLLHGLTNSSDSWICRTALEQYCEGHEIAVVMPTAGRSFYCDMKYGDAWYTHVAQEIPTFCESLLPLVPDPAHRYIAGNSMGGYGAYKIALKNPGKFAKAAAFSGVMDINGMIRDFPEYARDWLLCFGGNHAPEEEDLFFLIRKAKQLPQLYQYCGTADFLAEGNRAFSELCRERKIPLETVWEEDAFHEWTFWDAQFPAVLKWLET